MICYKVIVQLYCSQILNVHFDIVWFVIGLLHAKFQCSVIQAMLDELIELYG